MPQRMIASPLALTVAPDAAGLEATASEEFGAVQRSTSGGNSLHNAFTACFASAARLTMRGIKPMERLFFGLFAFFTGELVLAASPETTSQVSLDSVFIQRMLQQPVTTDSESTRIAALILFRTGNIKDGEALDEFEKRRLLARYLGEPFDFSGTLAQAIESEHTAEPIKQVVARALGSVMVDYAPPDSPGLRATPDSIEIPMVIRHSLRASATSV